jgi:hypothetical protein
MLAFNVCCADHVRHYAISAGLTGWEVRLEEDQTLRRLDHYRDWHRVERAIASFEREVTALIQRGWRVQLIDKPVAESHHGFDLPSRLAKLAAEPSDVDVD